MHCGWMDPEEWTERLYPLRMGPIEYPSEQVCPGWFKGQTFTLEATDAANAIKENYLHLMYPDGIPASLLDAARTLLTAWRMYEHWEVNEAKKQKG